MPSLEHLPRYNELKPADSFNVFNGFIDFSSGYQARGPNQAIISRNPHSGAC